MNPANLRQAAILVIASSFLSCSSRRTSCVKPPRRPTSQLGLGAAESHLGKGFERSEQEQIRGRRGGISRRACDRSPARSARTISPWRSPSSSSRSSPKPVASSQRYAAKREITPTFCTIWDGSTSKLGTSGCPQNLNAAMTPAGCSLSNTSFRFSARCSVDASIQA